MVMCGVMTVTSLDQPLLNMTSRSVLPDTFLPKAVPDNLVLKDQANILGWLHPAESVNLERSHDQKSVVEEPSGNKVAGDMGFHVIDDPQEAYFKIKRFLSEAVPAELTKDSKDLKRIEAVVFMDFVALEIEVMIRSWQDETTITVRDRSRSDVVHMHRLYEQLKESFARQTEQVLQDWSLQDLRRQVLPPDSLDEFEDDGVDIQTMCDRAQALLNDVTSCSEDVRVEGAQVLASWAQGFPESRMHIAEALLRSDSHLVEARFRNFNLSLAEVYPLAAMLRYTFNCPDAASMLKNSGIARKLFAMRRLENKPIAALVAKELSMAVVCLDKAGP